MNEGIHLDLDTWIVPEIVPGIAEIYGILCVVKVFWRPQLLSKLVNYLKQNTMSIHFSSSSGICLTLAK